MSLVVNRPEDADQFQEELVALTCEDRLAEFTTVENAFVRFEPAVASSPDLQVLDQMYLEPDLLAQESRAVLLHQHRRLKKARVVGKLSTLWLLELPVRLAALQRWSE